MKKTISFLALLLSAFVGPVFAEVFNESIYNRATHQPLSEEWLGGLRSDARAVALDPAHDVSGSSSPKVDTAGTFDEYFRGNENYSSSDSVSLKAKWQKNTVDVNNQPMTSEHKLSGVFDFPENPEVSVTISGGITRPDIEHDGYMPLRSHNLQPDNKSRTHKLDKSSHRSRVMPGGRSGDVPSAGVGLTWE